MNGKVDDKCRALLEISICAQRDGTYSPVLAWVDTAFDGHLVFSQELIERLQLPSLAKTDAVLADGNRVILNTYLSYVDWFGDRKALQVIANEGRFPLIGTALLDGRVLHVDYVRREVTLD